MHAVKRTCLAFACALVLTLVLLLGAAAIVAPVARAQGGPACAALAEMDKALAERFGEAQAWHGQENRGFQVRLYLNAGTGTWTLIIVRDGQACAVSAGEKGKAGPAADPTGF